MRRSDAYIPSSREGRGDRDAVRLAFRAGLIRRFGSGLYGFTPAGERVRRNVAARIDRRMREVGGQRVSLPHLQYRPDWDASGRWGSFEGEMFTFENREGREMCLAPSNEEGAVRLVSEDVRSYDDLPLLLYQIEEKHRDDHARGGLLRTKEFTMKDAYSLHADRDSLEKWYDRVRAAYCRFFEDVGLSVAVAPADAGVMGGSASAEFVAPADEGTCDLLRCVAAGCRFGRTDESSDAGEYADGGDCPDCGGRLVASEGIEVGHAFKLGTHYAKALDLTIDTADGAARPVEMGSYGVGVTRVIGALLERHGDGDGCRWPVTDAGSIAPFHAAVIPLRYEGEIREVADRIHEAGDVLLYDDDRTVGERFAESDLLGIPTKVVLGNHFANTGEVELESREGKTQYVDLATALEEVAGEGR